MTDPQLLIDENKKLKEKVLQLQKENDFFREKFKLAQSRQFGASSEKSPDQVDWLFNEAEAIEDESAVESNVTEITESTEVDIASTPTSTKKKTGRKPLPVDLPRETRLI